MAQHSSHLYFSLGIGVTYALVGIVVLHVYPELAMLGFVVTVIAGLAPNLDAHGSSSSRDLISLISILPPLTIVAATPGLQSSPGSRIVLVGVAAYITTRFLLLTLLQKYTTRRGMMHSIPVAIIAFEFVYLLFFDIYWSDRLFLATGAFVGYFSHLMLDGVTAVDNNGKGMPPEVGEIPVLKIASKDSAPNWVAYGTMTVLGYFVYSSLAPHLHTLTRAILASNSH